MNTKTLLHALGAVTLAVLVAGCPSKKSDNGAPAFPEPPTAPVQIDRMGRPAINTIIHKVLDTSGASSDAFNGVPPSADTGFATALGQIVGLLHACPSPGVAGALLPDVLTFNTNTAANYAILNGRGLTDDVFEDTLVAVYTSAGTGTYCSGAGGLIEANGSNPPNTDNVSANDVAFSTTFPFLAAPH